jgi:hypothetical protein
VPRPPSRRMRRGAKIPSLDYSSDPKAGLRTSDGRNIRAEAQTPAAAGVSLSKQTMHRTHGPEAETLWQTGTRWGQKTPSAASTRDVIGTPRSPWEPRLYGGAFGVSNGKLQMSYGLSSRP